MMKSTLYAAGFFAVVRLLPLLAAVPLAWDVRPGQPAPVTFDRYHGETICFSATFRGFGELPFSHGADVRLWFQTNGMGSAWWSVPATVQSNVLSAVWSPALDPGSDRVSLFFGAPSNAYAAAVLRLRHSPGFAPGTMPDPIAFHESDPVFTAWLAIYTPPDTSLEPATNYTDRTLGAFAATGSVSRATVYGTPTRWTDATGCVWEVTLCGWIADDIGLPDGVSVEWYGPSWNATTDDYYYDRVGWYVSNNSMTPEYIGNDKNADMLELDWGRYDEIHGYYTVHTVFTRPLATNIVGRIALTNDLPDTASITSDLADLRTESSLVYRLYSGSNVVAEVTNYNSQVHAPALRLMQLNESNEYVTVWTETNGLARTLAAATNYADEAISSRAAPRAWSRTTSGLGADAPADTTWVSTPRTVIAGGLEYAKVVDTYGEVWVLTSNGMAANFNPDTNAYFRITADDGTDIFSIEKSDAQVVGADADGITVGESSVTIPVGVVSAEHPTMFWRQALDSGSWADESSPPTGATVAWTGGTGAWVCTVTWSGTRPPSMFFRFTFLQEGGVVIRNNASTDISAGIYVNGVKFIPSVSGNNLIWTKQQ